MDISTPRQLLRSLGPLPETSARTSEKSLQDHCVAKGGRQKGIGKKVAKNEKKVAKKWLKKKNYQKGTEKESEGSTPFCLPPFAEQIASLANGDARFWGVSPP